MTIEPVQRDDYDKALDIIFRTTGSRRVFPSGKPGSLIPLLNSKRCNLYWVRKSDRIMAAGLAIHHPGRVAMIFHTRCLEPGGITALCRLLDKLSRLALSQGAAVVEVLITDPTQPEIQAFRLAGYIHLAHLIFMSRTLENLTRQPRDTCLLPHEGRLEWSRFTLGDEKRLARILTETFVDSLDCPAIHGMRRIEDIIEGYKASGIFRPDSWWLPRLRGNDLGCILINESAVDERTAEILYLGVIPRWRKKGIARAMLKESFAYMHRRGIKKISLAVDSGNAPALALYHQEGFRPINHQDVFITNAAMR